MNDDILTQLGLTIVYTAVGVLVILTERVERSRALRLWSLCFAALALDALAGVVIALFELPPFARIISWLALLLSAVFGVAGAGAFLGRPIPRGLFLLAGAGVVGTLVGLLFGVETHLLSAAVFLCVGASFLWAARLIFVGGVPRAVGRYVACSAFVAAGLYALAWPMLARTRFRKLEYFLDISVVMWGAAGVLLIHFERSRTRLEQMMTKERELRGQLERSERLDALGRLAAGVAHDFNNVLTTVIHGSELALRQVADRPKAAQYLEVVLGAARGASGFTRQLLALGRQRLPGRKPVRLARVLSSSVDMVRPRLRPTHRLELGACDEELAVQAGEGQLEQVLVNLCQNALAAMPDGGELGIVITAEPERLRVTVSDTGCGMDLATQRRIFEPFFTTRGERGGTGLGLCAVHAIVTQLDGSISVTSEPGRGSRFCVLLPRCPAPESDGLATPPLAAPAAAIRILVVDDQPQVLGTVSEGLRDAGFTIATASTAAQALAQLQREPPTLMLVELHLAEVSGLKLVGQARERLPGLPAIVMTGRATEDGVESSRHGVRWLHKPFSPTQLREAIWAALPG